MEIKVGIQTYSQKMAQVRMTSEDGFTATKSKKTKIFFPNENMKSRLDTFRIQNIQKLKSKLCCTYVLMIFDHFIYLLKNGPIQLVPFRD